ncbi:reticulon-like protein B12-like [Trifolium pratense]|uniref:Reticulon-like protein B12-like n=1 Tax=Trifolium pratense TaxID=57577 RepID=A0A2K3PM26_TRIPR|nr:reticulon-like protein B12-like [Trifolium pratense]
MGSYQRLFNTEITLHDILGSGQVADLIQWRKRNQIGMILLVTSAAFVIFERTSATSCVELVHVEQNASLNWLLDSVP